MAKRRDRFAHDFDHWRQAAILEPRGNDVLVGALLCKPVSAAATAGVIFFNNAGFLNMCGHGTIGLIASLAWLGRIKPGVHLIETPVGDVSTTLHDDGSVSVQNVPARRWKKQIRVETALGPVIGDIAWGGNWFFLINDHPFAITPEQIPQLTDYAWAVREGWKPRGSAATTAALSTISNSSPMTIPPTTAASYSVRERPGIARRAVPAPAPSWPAWRRMASCSRGNMAPGQHHRQPVYRQLPAHRGRHHPHDPRRSLGMRR